MALNSSKSFKALVWWWWIIFVVWLTNKRRLALFPVGTIVRDPHHCESPTRCKQGLNLRRTDSGLVEWSCAVVITTTPRRHNLMEKLDSALYQWIVLYTNHFNSQFSYLHSFYKPKTLKPSLGQKLKLILKFSTIMV